MAENKRITAFSSRFTKHSGEKVIQSYSGGKTTPLSKKHFDLMFIYRSSFFTMLKSIISTTDNYITLEENYNYLIPCKIK